MKALAELLIAVAELLEAEGRDLRRSTYKVGMALGLVALSVALALSAAAMLLVALFMFLQDKLSTVTAATLCGLFALTAAAFVANKAREMSE